MKDYKDKTIWIIGASSGIGAALAVNLAAKGSRVIISARNETALQSVRGDKNNIDILPFDVSTIKDVERATDKVFAQYKKIDSIVFLAAAYNPTKITEISVDEMASMMDINFMGAFHVVYCVLPHLIKQGVGQIALCGSVAAYRGLPNGQPYSATKAALMNFTESLRFEVAHHGIDVKLISPGFVRTPLTDKNDFSMPMMIEPIEAANYIAKGLLSSKFEIHFPFMFTKIMKFIRIIPDFLYFKLFQQKG